MPVFVGVPEETLTFLLRLAPVIHVFAGDFFFREGDDARSMFVLEEVRVAVFRTWEDRNVAYGICSEATALARCR